MVLAALGLEDCLHLSLAGERVAKPSGQVHRETTRNQEGSWLMSEGHWNNQTRRLPPRDVKHTESCVPGSGYVLRYALVDRAKQKRCELTAAQAWGLKGPLGR